jgi:probable O-glycosylation ligase (exosortase A-associated)
MRDILVVAIVLAGCLAALRRPWIGVMLWTWLSIMNPHRYTYGFAYSAPLAAAAAACTLLGLLMTKERASPFKGSPVTWLVLFMTWITLSLLAGIDPAGDYEQWKKVMKIDLFIVVALMLLSSKKHIFALMWVCAGSLALLGIKGGIYTISAGGGGRVWGPPNSFIEDNNHFALALVMTIPLLRFLQLQIGRGWLHHGLTATMVLCAAAALGSQSRGALIAIAAMGYYFWRNSRKKLGVGLALLAVGIAALLFMPDSWFDRMATIGTYQEDNSAMGRISAWWSAWNSAFHYPFGVGFVSARAELFAQYARFDLTPRAAHSIYFQVLGNHGFGGLFLFLGMLVATWRTAGWLRRQKLDAPNTKWCADLGTLCQASLVGYLVGGAFLSLAYFDLPYNILVLVVITRAWVEQKRWLTEPVYAPGWKTLPGLVPQVESVQTA